MRRGPSALLLATVVHAALLMSLAAVPSVRARVSEILETKPVELDLDVAFEPPPPPEEPAPDRLESGHARSSSQGFARVAAKIASRVVPERAEPIEPVAPPVEPERLPAREDPAAPPPGYRTSPVGVLGRDGTNPFLSTPLLEAAPEEKGAERAVRSSLIERDRRLGLGASGPVVAALEDVARTSTAAVESHAILEVVADGEGNVTSVTISEASEDRAGWDAVARGLMTAMRTKRVHVARGSRGVAMTIAIESRETLPSGAAPGVNVTLFDQKVHSGKNDRSAAVSILPLAKIPVEIPVPGRPGVTQTKTIVLPVPIPNVSGVFDVMDLGPQAPAARVVHAHATSEREL